MIINKIHINRFRGFNNTEFSLGKYITLIAGQNGTQKSTLLGLLTQPFTITDKDNPLQKEKPLSGGNFKSSFSDKFRLSPSFDKPKQHEWTLFLNDNEDFTVESIKRDNNSIRFWRKGDRSEGSGYVQLPVIFLSLKRLTPIGEEQALNSSPLIELSPDEKEFFIKWYKNIMISLDNVKTVEYLESKNKETLGVSTEHYDWHSNSAGQDNIGKILLAILSFKRLKEKFGDAYRGGLLAIDEIDATLYPGSQVKLIKALFKFCSDYKIQVIATTHSLPMLEEAASTKAVPSRADQINIVNLKKQNDSVIIEESLTFERITNHLNASLGKIEIPKISIFTEDKEAQDFTRAILGRKLKYLNFIDCTLGCENLISLSKKKVPSFIFPNSIVILDGDASASMKKNKLSNFICLPGSDAPEKVLAPFLMNLDDTDPFWTSKNEDYSKQICFRNYSLQDILEDRVKAKNWYIEQRDSKVWGMRATALYKRYLDDNETQKNTFIDSFKGLHSKILISLGFV